MTTANEGFVWRLFNGLAWMIAAPFVLVFVMAVFGFLAFGFVMIPVAFDASAPSEWRVVFGVIGFAWVVTWAMIAGSDRF